MDHHAPQYAQEGGQYSELSLLVGEENVDHWLKAGEALFRKPITFALSVAKVDGLPVSALPEIVFAGRSNVGKSSLLNALVGQNGLARTSNTPGRTQLLNFFNLNDQAMLVDVPGYGYAEAPKKLVKQWTHLIFDYLRGRQQLLRLCLLIDARHGIKDTDIKAMDFFNQYAVPFFVVATKIDKINNDDRAKLQQKLIDQLQKHVAAFPRPFFTSSQKGYGMDQLRAALAFGIHQ